MSADPYAVPAGLHPSVAKAVDQIDAAVFNGDCFWQPDTVNWLDAMLDRWKVQLAVNRVLGSDHDDDPLTDIDDVDPLEP